MKISLKKKRSTSSNTICVTLLCGLTPKHLCAQAALDPLLSNMRGFRDSFTVYALIPDSLQQMCVCEDKDWTEKDLFHQLLLSSS